MPQSLYAFGDVRERLLLLANQLLP